MHQPQTLEQLKKQAKSIRSTNAIYKENLSRLEKLALWITKNVGSMGFFFIIFVWTAFWLLWNTLSPINWRFDPFPAFVFWLFISNMVQIFLMPLIMIGQNLQGRHAEARAEADFEVNTKAEKEVETVLQHLENQNELVLKILNRLENKDSKFP